MDNLVDRSIRGLAELVLFFFFPLHLLLYIEFAEEEVKSCLTIMGVGKGNKSDETVV